LHLDPRNASLNVEDALGGVDHFVGGRDVGVH
jgi:hypothetical protein